jgi:hypothetical protein
MAGDHEIDAWRHVVGKSATTPVKRLSRADIVQLHFGEELLRFRDGAGSKKLLYHHMTIWPFCRTARPRPLAG